ncbi:MAG: hypothetical protein LC114_16005 [Bryobacterales bacterium]|nr:hypothetical protein [Bryobacterales bacterium]
MRNCSWLDFNVRAEKPVWGRKGTYTTSCPKSVISPDSEQWVQLFYTMKILNQRPHLWDMDARTVDALIILETEFRKEAIHA